MTHLASELTLIQYDRAPRCCYASHARQCSPSDRSDGNTGPSAGTTYRLPALSRWCPVSAVLAWLEAADLHEGVVLIFVQFVATYPSD